MKLYHHVSRFYFRRWFPKGSPQERHLLWGASLKPGDVINACTGFNVRIASIVPEIYKVRSDRALRIPGYGRIRTSSRPGWLVCGFKVTDTRGMLHRTGSCCWPKETVAEIESFWQDLETVDDGLPSFKTVIQDRLKQGLPICDQDGVVLPDCVS